MLPAVTHASLSRPPALSAPRPWPAAGRVGAWATYLGAVAFCVVVFGYRDYSFGADTARYAARFTWLKDLPLDLVAEQFRGGDVGFYLLSDLLVGAVGVRGTFVAYSVVLAVAVVYAARRLCGKKAGAALALYATLPALYVMGSNVLRHGLALSALLVGLGLLLDRRYVLAAAAAAAGLVLHASSVIFLLCALAARKASTRTCAVVFGAASVASFLSMSVLSVGGLLGVDVVALLTGDRFAEFVSGETYGYDVGFRPDFYLYTMAPVLVALVGTGRRRGYFARISPDDRVLLNTYLLAASALVLSFSFPYSDRVGLFAWVLIPVVVFVGGPKRRTGSLRLTLRGLGVAAIGLANLILLSDLVIP